MQTTRALADLTDEGLFEIIATSVLRIADARCAGLSHPGVNASGRTRKSPVDGVTYAPGDPNHLILTHHTTGSDLRHKWLRDPAKVTRRSSTATPIVAGDVIKTAELVAKRRLSHPRLQATLFLTTNLEVDEALFSDTVAAGAAAGIEIEIWTGSRLAQVLDTQPDGQWVRRTRLGITQDVLSSDLLRQLSADSLARFAVGDDPAKRVSLALDDVLAREQRPFVLLAAASGTGKTVACYRALEAQVRNGGFGLILQHELIERSSSLDQAVLSALRAYEPSLTAAGGVLSIATPANPLLLLVEDISRAPDPGRLLDRLTLWATGGEKAEYQPSGAVRLLCPVWPHLMSLGSSALENQRRSALLEPPPLSLDEGRDCVVRAAAVEGESLSIAAAETIATALGHDPLLIGLNSDWASPSPSDVISRFVDLSLERAAGGARARAARLRSSLIRLGREMLYHRRLNPAWSEITGWDLGDQTSADIDLIVAAGELLRLDGALGAPSIRFRHDRVRGWILLRAARSLQADEQLTSDLMAEPAFAEILAELLLASSAPPALLGQLVSHNPLALFHALRLGQERPDANLARIVDAAATWSVQGGAIERRYQHARWEAMAALRSTQGDFVPPLVDRFPRPTIPALLGKLRSGDFEGGVAICEQAGLHAAASWLPDYLRMACQRRGQSVIREIAQALVESQPGSARRAALLFLAGVSGEPELVAAVVSAWGDAEDRMPLLAAYLWSFARCVTPENASLHLDPVCALWATLPAPKDNRSNDEETTIYDLAAHDVRDGFRLLPPEGALDYFFARAASSDLAWPIQYMLHDTDHPAVVAFIAQSLAETLRRSGDQYATSSLRALHWRGLGDPSWPAMSDASREVLRSLWQDSDDDELRIAAFDWWASSRDPRDMSLLCALSDDGLLGERALRNRLERGDVRCHGALVEKLNGPRGAYWWHYARASWSPVLSCAFEAELASRAERKAADGPDGAMGFEFAGIFARMGRTDAERLLLRHWDAFEAAPRFILIALYVGTPELLRRAEKVISEHPTPKRLFKWIGPTWGIRHSDHPGIIREAQVLNLAPYLDLLEDGELRSLGQVCNEKGWFQTRRQLIDPRTPDSRIARTPAEIRSKLDGALLSKFSINHDLDFALETGLTRADIVEALGHWLKLHREVRALELGAEVICHVGERADVDVLSRWAGGQGDMLESVMTDTRFAVARRTA